MVSPTETVHTHAQFDPRADRLVVAQGLILRLRPQVAGRAKVSASRSGETGLIPTRSSLPVELVQSR